MGLARGFPEAEPHRQAFLLAREVGLHRTVHAGEDAGSSSVRKALDRLAAERIGHGVRTQEDSELVSRVAATFVTMEMCPRSNVQNEKYLYWRGHSHNGGSGAQTKPKRGRAAHRHPLSAANG